VIYIYTGSHQALLTTKKHQGEASMRQLTIAAAAVAIAALISAAPAAAEHIGGGPMKQNGQCFKNFSGSDYRFGTWQACPAPAAAPAATTKRRHRA
jgi:hypothetical protein